MIFPDNNHVTVSDTVTNICSLGQIEVRSVWIKDSAVSPIAAVPVVLSSPYVFQPGQLQVITVTVNINGVAQADSE